MTKVVSTINLKGGVGKTSLTVALAEFMAFKYGERVLVVDLDPQTNATVSLLEEEAWKQRNEQGQTIYQMFKDRMDKTEIFDVNTAIVKNVSNLRGGIHGLDLLPSSIDLIDIQDRLSSISDSGFFVTSPVTILRETLSPVLEQYKYVLLDCPPNLGIITLNGLYISDYYLIPSIPDILSTYGIPQILRRTALFTTKAGIHLKPLGIVVTMFRTALNLHNSMVQTLRAKASSGEYPRVFDTAIPLASKAAESADVTASVNTLKQKYGYGNLFEKYEELAEEFMKHAS
jgi:chromosome partitioning protein